MRDNEIILELSGASNTSVRRSRLKISRSILIRNGCQFMIYVKCECYVDC